MSRLAALVACLAVMAGCAAEPRPAHDQEESAASTGSTTTTKVSTAAPTRPYVLKGRLYVERQVVPGRFGTLTTGGDAWLAYRMDGPWTWGVGRTVHTLGREDEPRLSASGRWLVVSPGTEACMGESGTDACVLRVLDTTGVDARRRLTVHRTLGTRPGRTTQVDVLGVTDRGVVVLDIYEGGWEKWVWDAAGGSNRLEPLADDNDVPLSVLLRTDPNSEPGPARRWRLGTAWRDAWRSATREPPTTRLLHARRVDEDGATVRLRPPRGWRFADSGRTNLVFWESPRTFVILVVDSHGGGDRLARCDIPLATCVLVTG